MTFAEASGNIFVELACPMRTGIEAELKLKALRMMRERKIDAESDGQAGRHSTA